MKLNLHTHTRWSDGYLTFLELLNHPKKQELACLAITDHDTTKAWSLQNLEETRAYMTIDAVSRGILQSEQLKIMQGIELSANDSGTKVHILGLGIDQPDDQFNDYLDTIDKYRWSRSDEMTEGLKLDPGRVKEEVGIGVPSRMHFGYIMYLKEKEKPEEERDPEITCARKAMDKYVGKVSFDANFVYSPQEAIERILNLGGVPVWAHPERIDLPFEETFKRYQGYAQGKPFGIEVTDPEKLEAMMERFDVVTVGNDFHGSPYDPADKSLVVEVPDELGAELIRRLEAAHKAITK